MTTRIIRLFPVLAALWISCFSSFLLGEEQENKQVLATSPEELVDMLQEMSFLPPAEYRQKLNRERSNHSFAIDLPQLPQKLDEETDPRRTISADLLRDQHLPDHLR